MGGEQRPILFASHQLPRRDCRSNVRLPQCCRSVENERYMSALEPGVTGRWITAHLLPMRRGKKAASLSSGSIIMPRRSKVLKSRVSASDTSGPRAEYAV